METSALEHGCGRGGFRLPENTGLVQVRIADAFASCGGTGVAKLISTYRSNDLSVGPHAVDYYVYRLRRLII